MVGLAGFDLPGGVLGAVLGDGTIVLIVVVEPAFDVGLDALLELAELAIAAPDLPAELGQLARAEDHQRHDEHHEDLERADLRQSSSFRAVFPKAMVLVRVAKAASGSLSHSRRIRARGEACDDAVTFATDLVRLLVHSYRGP